MTFSDEEQQNVGMDVDIEGGGSGGGSMEVHSTSPGYHPRYNTPVSEINEQETAVVVEEEGQQGQEGGMEMDVDVEVGGREEEKDENGERENEAGVDLERGHRRRKRRSSSSSSEDDVGRLAANVHLKAMVSSTTTTTDGVVTQSCTSSTFGYGNLKEGQMPGSNMTSTSALIHHQQQLDTIRFGLPTKDAFPSCEFLPGGRLVFIGYALKSIFLILFSCNLTYFHF